MKNIFDVAVYQKLHYGSGLSLKTDRVSHVWCNFKPAWLLVSNYRNFGKLNMLKDGTVVNTNSLACHETIVSATEASIKTALMLYQNSFKKYNPCFVKNLKIVQTSMDTILHEKKKLLGLWRDFS